MSTKHTPGPWKTLGYSIVKGSRRCTIADTYMQSGNSVSLGVEVTKANVRLIAAAPDLLRACELIVDCERNGWPPDSRQFSIVTAAIAKANGEA